MWYLLRSAAIFFYGYYAFLHHRYSDICHLANRLLHAVHQPFLRDAVECADPAAVRVIQFRIIFDVLKRCIDSLDVFLQDPGAAACPDQELQLIGMFSDFLEDCLAELPGFMDRIVHPEGVVKIRNDVLKEPGKDLPFEL